MIIDAEADGLLDFVTKIHVLAYEKDGAIHHTHDYGEMRWVLTNAKVLIGHNIICYDVPMFERILGIKINAQLIDTLALSWYLNHKRKVHGLDSYGAEFGIPKPKIDDWQGLTPEQYAHRCREDVKINSALWKQLKTKLLRLYKDKPEADRLINYLGFKMDCLREQERSKWHFDAELAKNSLDTLLVQEQEKLPLLVEAMPKVLKYDEKSPPPKPYKKDGTLSVAGAKWLSLLKKHDLPEDYKGTVTVLVSEEEANPGSHAQIKDWLFSLGWEPITFKFVKDHNGERKIPQVRVDGKEGKELCPSVKELIEEHPAVAILDGLTIIQHRISIFSGFLRDAKDGKLIAGAGGLTNTLRFKHRELVNLPGVAKAWGEEIRGCLIAPDGYVLCGSDMNSLEENTKKHYMWPYDPDYVTEMSKEGFDAHLDLAKHAGAVTQDEIDKYVKQVAGFKDLKPIRTIYKAANYSCIYGVGAPKLAREIKVPLKQAQDLIAAYWKRNWAVKQLAEDQVTKRVGGELWLFNPVSRFWYSLRNMKDIFSTLNQGTGVYCFDKWIMAFREVRTQLTGQFHDEVILCIKEGAEEKCRQLLTNAIEQVNKELKLNINLGVDIQFGKRYSDIH